MTAFTNAQKTSLRKYLGFPRLFNDFNSRLEGAFNVLEALDDDDATYDSIIAVLTKLATLEAKIEELHCTAFIKGAGTDKVEIDSIRAIHYLKMEGRRYINQLAIAMGTRPNRDYFSASELDTSTSGMDGQVFPYSGYE